MITEIRAGVECVNETLNGGAQHAAEGAGHFRREAVGIDAGATQKG